MNNITAKESNSEANKLIDSEDEAWVLAVDPMIIVTRYGRVSAKHYNQVVTDPSEAVPTPAKVVAGTSGHVGPHAPPPLPPKQDKAIDRRPKPCFSRSIDKETNPIRFDIVKQLDQIWARVSLPELLRLSPTTREALREALADAEVFMTQLAKHPQPEVL